MANIVEIKGNIFESSCKTIVNTINCVGIMGKGIAFEYKHRFPDMYKSYLNLCETNQLKPGLLQLWKKSSPWILNFPTKNHWKNPSKMEYIESGLKKFAVTYEEREITSIAFPQLGTFHGGLNWEEVKESMYKHLKPLANLDVEIYHFDPKARDTFFDKLFRTIHRFDVSDYKTYLNIPKQQAKLIINVLESLKESKDFNGEMSPSQEGEIKNKIHSMLELQNIKGVGEKTFEKIYTFVNSNQNNRLQTEGEIQPSFKLE